MSGAVTSLSRAPVKIVVVVTVQPGGVHRLFARARARGVRARPSGLPAMAFADGSRYRKRTAALFDEPTSNGYADGVINKVKVIKRRT
jgi:hypothetical protein